MINGVKRHSMILAAYIVLTLLMTMPLAWRFTDHIAGQGGDPWQTLWRFDEKKNTLETALYNQQIGSFLKTEFLGGGEARLVNVTVWPWMPLHYILGEPIGYNLIFWLSFILSGYGMYVLVQYFLNEYQTPNTTLVPWWRLDTSAFLAGILYMFLPYHTAHSMGHFGAMQLQWLPFTIWAFFKWLKKPSFGNSFALGFFFILQAFSEHHYVLWLGIALVVYAVCNLRILRQTIRASKVSLVVLAAAVVLVALVYWPTVRLASQHDSSIVLGVDQTIRFSADLFSFISPSLFHPIWRWSKTSEILYTQIFSGNSSEATHFLGIIPLLLVLFFSHAIPKNQKKLWTVFTLTFFVISLGPRLHVLGTLLPLPLPYALIDSLPFFSAVRAVARASAMVGLGFSVLFGWVLYTQLHRIKSSVLIGCLLLLEFLFAPLVLQSSVLPEVYTRIRDLPGTSLIEIPAATNYNAASRSLYASHTHGKTVLANSALERGADPSAEELIKQTPGIKQLLFVRTTDLAEDRVEFFKQDSAETLLDAMKWFDVAGILIHSDSVTERQFTILNDFLEKKVGFTAQHFNDAVLYTADAAFTNDGVFVTRGKGWDQVILDKEKNVTIAAFSTKAEVRIINTTDTDQVIRFSWNVAKGSTGTLLVRHNNEIVGSTITVRPGESILEFTSALPGTFILENPEFHPIAP